MPQESKQPCFPSNKYEALAMLYLQNQNLSGFTPEELAGKYQEAYEKIYKYCSHPNWE